MAKLKFCDSCSHISMQNTSASLNENSIIGISYIKTQENETINDKTVKSAPVDFETAITGAGFGRFNIMLIIMTIPSSIANIFVTSVISFVVSEAECDLSLTLDDIGLLNAITYIGMITSAFFWGMIGDTYGRRPVLLYAYSLDVVTYLFGSLSTRKWMLLTAKFFSGLVMCSPYTVLVTYLSEFHATCFRPQLITIVGVCTGVAGAMIPLLAWWIMPLKLHWKIIDGVLEFKSWQIFYLLCCIPSLLAAIAHYLLPETPKFLMTKGRYDEARDIFRKMYTNNTGNLPEIFSFSELCDVTYDVAKQNEPIKESKYFIFKNIFYTMKPLFYPPHVMNTILMSGILFGGFLGGNTLRLWLPVIFTKMDAYTQMINGENVDATFCEILDYTPQNTSDTIDKSTICIIPAVEDEVYINNIVVSLSPILGYFIVAAILSKLGKKILLGTQYIYQGILVIANYWSMNTLTTVIISSLYLTFNNICTMTATSISIELYPTNMRTMASTISVLCGRIGTILGNILFPVLLQTGCLSPFLCIGGFMFLSAILSFLLPGTENKPLR